MTKQETAIIIGAGPAGLTAAYELLQRTHIKPIVLEATADIGGISKTVNYKGNRIDIGGHRFFSKSDRVMEWWQRIMPVQGSLAKSAEPSTDPEKTDNVLLIRTRLSRILFLRKFFDYPITLSMNTVQNLGLVRLFKVALSYALICILPKKDEKSLEDFLINRFGQELYLTFFKDYTEKVWGVPCNKIKPEWGAQRIKGLSMTKALIHAAKKMFKQDSSIGQKDTETTLIEQFLYPKYGPGQMWETVAQRIQELGGEIRLGHRVTALRLENQRIVDIEVEGAEKSDQYRIAGNYFFSTMPIKDLIRNMGRMIPNEVAEIAQGLVYRDFITVGLLLSGMIAQQGKTNRKAKATLLDNWIYIQEPDVKVGRLQIFNNWSPYMVQHPANVWVGLEYFCNEGDELWNMPDATMTSFAIDELAKIGMIEKPAVLDSTVIRVAKTYPAYFGTYDQFSVIQNFTDKVENLFLIGRNGMHKYNNQDHSMLTAMTAVDNIIRGVKTKENIWAVNTEKEYHESK